MFLKILFYLPVLGFIIYHLIRFCNAKDVLRWQRTDRDETKRYEARKNVDPKAKAEYSSSFIARSLLAIAALAFEFIGLLSSSWFVFFGLILGGLVLGTLLRPFRYTRFRVWIMSGFHALMLLFAVINSFHLHLRFGSFWSWWLSIM